MQFTLEVNPRFAIGDKVYMSKEFGRCNYLERYEAVEHTVKDIHIEYQVASNTFRYAYIFDDSSTGYVDTGKMASTPEELYARYLEEIKSMMPQSMQDYMKEHL